MPSTTAPLRSSGSRFSKRDLWFAAASLLAAFPVSARAQVEPKPLAPSSVTPWTGERGIVETIDQIMARERVQGPPDLSRGLQDAGEENEVEREDLHQNPASPQAPMWPPPTVPGAGPVLSQLPGSGSSGGPNLPQTVGTSFLGASSSESGFIPPDTVGAVGPTQILVVANGRIKVFSKTGVLGGLNASTNTFFNSVRNGSTTSDPQVKYDRLSGRWFVTMINVSTPNRVLIAVSSGSTITSSASFTFYFFQQDTAPPAGNAGQLADYPKVGVDANAIVIGCNMFSGNNYVGTTAWVVRKSSVLSGGPMVVTALRGIVPSAGGAGPSSPSGVDNDDPTATESYLIGVSNTAFGQLVLRRISNPGGSPTVGGNLNVTVPTTTLPINQAALGSTASLDALDDRLFNCQLHKNRVNGVTSLWATHNIQVNSSGTASNSGGRNGSRWYQIGNVGTTPALIQSGTLFDSAAVNPRGYWIPSVAMSGQGHMALGSSYAGAADRAGVATSGRLSGDPLGTIQAPTLAVVSGSNYNVQGSSPQRWGDYSAVMVDPTDDQTLWAFGEYCNANNSWGVRVVQLLAPPPATPVSAVPSTLSAGQTGVSVVVTGSSASGSAFFDTEAGFNRIAAAFSGTGITVNSIVWNGPTQITLNVDVSGGAAPGTRDLTVTNPDGQSSSSSGGIVTVGGGDCNQNGIPDAQDIANGTSQDCDSSGVPDECQADSDGDGAIDACDGCPSDPNKTAPGACGCGVAETDNDGDGTPNCIDGCPSDPNKIAPGQCGCGTPDTDGDGDGTANCIDGCPNDPNKIAPGQCGCGAPDTDSDGDGTANCLDGCPNDPNKIAPGVCGCGVPDTDSDGDGTPNCLDGCPNDPNKTAPGICGCGVPDVDSDGDGAPNCLDGCPNDPNKTSPGVCGCGFPDTDSDSDGVADCLDNCPAIANSGQGDCDFDFEGDACEIAAGAPDCNGNGVPDACDIGGSTSQDQNGNGIPDECEAAGSPYCFGDGSGAACPCGNTGAAQHGCANSVGQSALLAAVGTTSPDTIGLYATGELPTALTIFLQGTASISPAVYGDGLRCVGGALKRLYSKSASGGAVHAPGAGDPSITARSAALGDPISSGSTRYYMTYYRDANAGFCPSPVGNTFNSSNSLSILW